MSYEPSVYGLIPIPDFVKTVTTVADIIEFVYPIEMLLNVVENNTILIAIFVF